jgi:hypothetical protein
MSADSGSSLDAAADAATSDTTLRATLAVEPHEAASCAIVRENDTADVVNQNLTFESCDPGRLEKCGECHANVVGCAEGSGTEKYVRSDLDAHCVCPVFHQVECVPTIERIQDGSMIISVLFPDRETLRRLIDAMRQTGATVSVQGITRPNAESSETVLLYVSDVTDKQREALQVAMDAGYFDEPRRADLGDLAAELGVSKSAVSQRLKAVESKLLHGLMDIWCK